MNMRFIAIIFLILQAIALAEAVEWTLHKSCYKDEKLRNAVTSAMKAVVSRANLLTSKLPKTTRTVILGDNKKLKKAAQVLVGNNPNYYSQIVKEVVAKFEPLTALKDPVGVQGPPGKQYEDSDDWAKLNGHDKSYLNFVIYCAPEISELEDGRYYDHGNKLVAEHDDPMVLMYKDGKAGDYVGENVAYGITSTQLPEGDRAKIPETITIHPVWLKQLVDGNRAVLREEFVKKVAGPEVLKQWLESTDNQLTPMDALKMLDGLLNHELFHLDAFGALQDLPGLESIWKNDVANKNSKIADVLAYLSIVVELTDKGYTIQESGEITAP